MMLEIRDVRKKFGSLTVLDGISLDVEKGDVTAILGPSGSGKTTFLRCVNFLERADSGTMVFDGERVDMAAAKKPEIVRVLLTKPNDYKLVIALICRFSRLYLRKRFEYV